MGNRSKDKGKTFEREVASLFSEATGLSWQRVPNSGAFIGGKNASRISSLSESQVLLTRGDIIPHESYSGCVIECKWHGQFPFHKLLGQCKELDGWISQAIVDYELSDGKVLMVIFKIDFRGSYICSPKDQLDCLLGVDYLYHRKDGEDIVFRISKFDSRWICDHKDQILALCNS